MNIPNFISFSRIVLIFIIVGLFVMDTRFAYVGAFVLFCIAAVSDFVDGYLARKYNQITTLGIYIDSLADKFLVLFLIILFVEKAMIPAWFAILILFREIAVTSFRDFAHRKGVSLPAEKIGKLKAVCQFIGIGFGLLFLVVGGEGEYGDVLYGACVGFLVGATVLAYVSMVRIVGGDRL